MTGWEGGTGIKEKRDPNDVGEIVLRHHFSMEILNMERVRYLIYESLNQNKGPNYRYPQNSSLSLDIWKNKVKYLAYLLDNIRHSNNFDVSVDEMMGQEVLILVSVMAIKLSCKWKFT